MASIDEYQQNMDFTIGGKSKTGKVTFLPEPERRPRRFTLFSVDDHIVEPPNAFAGRVPRKLADRAPRVVEKDDGNEVWLYDGNELPNVGFNAVAGRPVLEYSFEPTRFDEMRRGAWDIDARIDDMDLNGVWASLCFPSFLPGFTGQRIQQATDDRELALATFRAWNDWNLEQWAGSYPDRMVPLQLPWLLDPELGAEEIRRNAARGFHAITFSEAPEKLGFPSLHTGHWDPMWQACEETETVVCLHVGSSGASPATTPDAPSDVIGVLFFGYAMFTAVDWLYSMIPVKFPNIKIALSEGGIGWVAGLMDRLDHILKYHEMYGTWTGIELTPREVLTRNFWFCAIDDTAGFEQRHHIGVDHICIESDYPHADSTWPDTQRVVERQIGRFPADEIAKMTWSNASELFRHPVPEAVTSEPDAPWPSEIARGSRTGTRND